MAELTATHLISVPHGVADGAVQAVTGDIHPSTTFPVDALVAAICHAPWTLLEAGTLSGRTLTSYPSIRGDVRRGGATVVDQEVCVDGNLVTSRDPDDIPAFCAAAVELFAGS